MATIETYTGGCQLELAMATYNQQILLIAGNSHRELEIVTYHQQLTFTTGDWHL